jgi:McbB family protein
MKTQTMKLIKTRINNMQFYNVEKFNILKSRKNTYLYTPNLSLKLLDPRIIKTMELLQDTTIISEEELPLDNDIKIFLCDRLQLLTKIPMNYFKEITVITNDEELSAAVTTYFKKYKHLNISTHDNADLINTHHKNLIFYFNTQYNRDKYHSITKHVLQHKNLYLITGYLLDKSFVIDNLFNQLLATPCHLCNIKRLLHLCTDHTLSSASWIKFYQELLNDGEEHYIPSPTLEAPQKNLIMFYICKTIKSFINRNKPTMLLEHVSKRLTIDLYSGETNKFIPSHWENCICNQ